MSDFRTQVEPMLSAVYADAYGNYCAPKSPALHSGEWFVDSARRDARSISIKFSAIVVLIAAVIALLALA